MVFGYQRAGHIHAHVWCPNKRFRGLRGSLPPLQLLPLRPPRGPGTQADTALNLKHDINSGEKWLTQRMKEQQLLGSHMKQGMEDERCGTGAHVLPVPTTSPSIFHSKGIFEQVFSCSPLSHPISSREMFFFVPCALANGSE